MNKTITLTILLLGAAFLSLGQVDTGRKVRHFDQVIGVQINELTKQVFSINNSNSVNTNPFLITYDLTERDTHWGLRAGLGFTYADSTGNEDPNNSGSNTLTEKRKTHGVQFRIGVQKTFSLSDKFTSGVGLDLVYKHIDSSLSETSTAGQYGYTATSKTNLFGGGPMVWVRYNVSKRILIGTEISIYYLSGHQKGSISYMGYQGTPDEDINNKQTEGKINLPVAFFLSLKF